MEEGLECIAVQEHTKSGNLLWRWRIANDAGCQLDRCVSSDKTRERPVSCASKDALETR